MQPRDQHLAASQLRPAWLRLPVIAAHTWPVWAGVFLWTVTVPAAVLVPVLEESASNWLNALVLVIFATVGAVIVLHRSTHPVGWIIALGTLLWALGALGVEYAVVVLGQRPHSLGPAAAAAVLGPWARALGWTLMASFVLLLFPDGRLPSARWRPVALCAAAYLGLWTVAALLAPAPADDRLARIRNPFGVQALSHLQDLAIALSLPILALCAAALIHRFGTAKGDERQQLKWLAYGVALPIVLIGLTLATRNGNLPWAQTVVIIPLAIGIAILRYHLYDIDLLINRTLVYGALTGCVVGLYILVVGGLGVLFRSGGSSGIAFVATGIVAVLFQPLRASLQRGVNHMMYGQRDDPYDVMSALGRRLEESLSPEGVLPGIAEAVQGALKLPYVGIAIRQDGSFTRAADSGSPGDRVLALPLIYQHEIVGRLLLSPRRGDDDLSPADYRLVHDLARQAGAAVHTIRLNAELQQARERLVTAREEERRRLRRDLHDGLGPQLGSQTLTLTAVKKLLRHDPDAAETLLDDAMTHAQDAITDIRRLVYQLRPPALDDLGLLGSLRETAARYSHNGLQVTVDPPKSPPPLPAAVEVACYRIVQEALTNVVRHASATYCAVRLQVDDTLRLEILDNGIGLGGNYRAGVGVLSMRERAEELGGSCALESRPDGGTVVRAFLPLKQEP